MDYSTSDTNEQSKSFNFIRLKINDELFSRNLPLFHFLIANAFIRLIELRCATQNIFMYINFDARFTNGNAFYLQLISFGWFCFWAMAQSTAKSKSISFIREWIVDGCFVSNGKMYIYTHFHHCLHSTAKIEAELKANKWDSIPPGYYLDGT